MGLEVVEVVGNPSFFKYCDNPEQELIQIRKATGIVSIPVPNIQIMTKKCEEKDIFHAELCDGSRRTTERIKKLESDSWFVAAVIVVRRKSN